MKKIVLDTDICAGHGRCYTFAPELFYDDESGFGQIITSATLNEDNLEQAERAVKACPEVAISIVD